MHELILGKIWDKVQSSSIRIFMMKAIYSFSPDLHIFLDIPSQFTALATYKLARVWKLQSMKVLSLEVTTWL